MSDVAGSETQTQTEGTLAPSYAVPTLQISRVLCTQKHVMKGLFVLFRPTPPPPAEKSLATKIYEYVVGEEPQSTGPNPPYLLGMTDAEGYIGPPIEMGADVCMNNTPDAYKLLPGQSYDVYFIQHPSAVVAMRIAAEINAGSTDYGSPHAIKLKSGEPVLEVPEDSSYFIPRGADLYDGFILCRDMPFAECAPVIKQVQRLQAHLGALRYMVGTTNWPYVPDVGADSDKSGGVNDGLFDVRTMNAVFRFQSDAQTRAFKVKGGGADGPHAALVDYASGGSPKDNFAPKVDRTALSSMQARYTALRKSKAKLTEEQVKEKTSLDAKIKEEKSDVARAESVAGAWAYLDGEEIAAPKDRPDPPDGAVARATGKALQTWLEQGLRKPGAILVVIQDPRGWSLWMRPEAARSWHAWNEIVKALGFDYGVCVNHTFRSAQVDIGKAGYGRSARSIHKTGLAMDLGLEGNFSRSVAGWPVAYVHEDDEGRVWWRLYGPAKQALSADATQAAALAAPLIERLNQLRAVQADSPIVSTMLVPAIDKLLTMLQATPVSFFATYYKWQIQRWSYDAWHSDGGTAGPRGTAEAFYKEHRGQHLDEDIAALSKKSDAGSQRSLAAKQEERAALETSDGPHKQRTAFLDLTALAELVNLSRIHAFKSGWGEKTRSVKAADLGTLASWLGEAKSSRASGDRVTVSRGKVKMTTTVSALDAEFMTAWNAALKAMKKEIAKSVKVNAPQIVITLSWSPAKIEDAKKIAAKLREMAGKKFYGVLADEGVSPVQSAEAWAQYIEDKPQKLEEQAPANQNVTTTAGIKTPSSKAKPVSWTLTLQPIFDVAYTPDPAATSVADTVKLMPGDLVEVPAPGQPIGMEWWHFQRSDLLGSGKSRRMWGDFLIEVGWTRECLLENTGSALYYRAGVGYPESELEKAAY